jgi:beta-galactosidase
MNSVNVHVSTRRTFLTLGAAAPLASLGATASMPAVLPEPDAYISMNGAWQFRLDPAKTGEAQGWHQPATPGGGWSTVTVPHTWQVEPENTEYMGMAWYRRAFDAPQAWSERWVRVEFEAVFHTATVWLDGIEMGRHLGRGYTAFVLDLSPHLHYGSVNTLAVRADNSFNEAMLPRGKSSDWAHDGGIYRPVSLLVSPKIFIERVWVDAEPDLSSGIASAEVHAVVRNASSIAADLRIGFRIVDEETGLTVSAPAPQTLQLPAGERKSIALPVARITKAKLWHFDRPNLYRLEIELSNGHSCAATFGVRKIETRNGGFYLNGERVRLMGVERMAGSNPEYGMAEPSSWIAHDHADMKNLNCIYTRVHWQQDRRVLDWCDRHGMLIQTEVPTWGGDTFAGMTNEPSPEIMNNGLEQLREMIERDRNHPCIFSWGVCNEIQGQNPPAYAFAKRMYQEAKRLDPRRLVTYASNSLQKTPGKDVAGLMDYIMWNEYYESWYKGTPADLARNLEEVHQAFPDKAIVISEYGWCACTPDRPEGDGKRLEVLSKHDAVFRAHDYVAGLIFFCYNDYRTHIGDKGTGVTKQRVHGVVDLYGARKPSYEQLRADSSPIESLEITGAVGQLRLTVRTRQAVPSYTLRGYKVRAVVYGFGDIPLERPEAPLPELSPGQQSSVDVWFAEKAPVRVEIAVLRPTGSSVASGVWHP